MSTTCADLGRRALRAVGAIPAGKIPSGINAETVQEYLQSVILDLPGLLKNGRFHEVAVTSAYTARESDRCTVTAPGVVTLPTTVSCEGYTRPPRDLARVQILGADVTNAGLWVYSATLAIWSNVLGLKGSSDSPFGPEDDQGVAFITAVNIAADYGAEAELGQRTIAIANEATKSFRSRFKRSQPIDWSRPEPFDPLSGHDGHSLPNWCDY